MTTRSTSSRPTSGRSTSGRTHPAPPPAPQQNARLVVVRVFDDIHRVDDATGTVGYVEKVGVVYVSLKGPVYNTSLEIAQCLDLEDAVERLRAV